MKVRGRGGTGTCLGVAGVVMMAGIGCAGGSGGPREGLVQVTGGRVWYRVVGNGSGTPILLLHGGPGFTSHYLDPMARLGDERPVIFYDQLGCGRSDRPGDPSLWRVERFVEELAQVRAALGLRRVHLFGHSWGTMLAVDYLLTRPEGVRSLVLASPALSIPRWLEDTGRLRRSLPPEVQETLLRHERAGTTDSDEYQQASAEFEKRFVIRLDPMPPEVEASYANQSAAVYGTMWGPSEFHGTGNLKDYDRTPRLGEIALPTLFTAGRHDEATPEATAWYAGLVPGAETVIFEHSAHMTMNEEPDRYLEVIRDFLRRVESDER